ncbi:MAG: FliI/YscN family ATPase [bacterium]
MKPSRKQLKRIEKVNLVSVFIKNARQELSNYRELQVSGRVEEILGVLITAGLRHVKIGEICRIESGSGYISAEVVGFRRNQCLLMPYTVMHGLRPDARVIPTGRPFRLKCGPFLKGQVLNGLGELIGNDMNKGLINGEWVVREIHKEAPEPLERKTIDTFLPTGIPAIDGFLCMGQGQRIGVFAAAGTGKSTLMSNIARSASADVVVINLIGERGREVREFIEESLGYEGLKRSIVVAATSDQPAIVRLKSAYVATTIAEYFRDMGLHVLFMMDSVTRFARALREIGLARGEMPSRGGYPPSVFAELPKLMERAGTNSKGSITALYTVLVAGDDLSEPVADEVLSILDGHIILSRKLAAANQYPAIDILRSKSRLMNRIISPEHGEIVGFLLSKYALCDANEEAIRFGFYEPGKNKELDDAVNMKPGIEKFLFDSKQYVRSIDDTINTLKAIAGMRTK